MAFAISPVVQMHSHLLLFFLQLLKTTSAAKAHGRGESADRKQCTANARHPVRIILSFHWLVAGSCRQIIMPSMFQESQEWNMFFFVSFSILFWTPKSIISPDILCHILFWCVRTACLAWSSTMFNQAIWEHGLSLLEFWASWKFDSRGRLIHACRNMMKYVALNRSVWFQTVLSCWFSPGLSMTKTQPAHWVVPLLSPNGCRSQLQSPQSLHNWTAGCESMFSFWRLQGTSLRGDAGPALAADLHEPKSSKIIQNRGLTLLKFMLDLLDHGTGTFVSTIFEISLTKAGFPGTICWSRSQQLGACFARLKDQTL